MSSLCLDRRQFLAITGAAYLAHLGQAKSDDLLRCDQLFLTAFKDVNGQFSIALSNCNGEIINTHRLPARGHGFAVSPNQSKAIIFARRPGNFALCFDPQSYEAPTIFHAPKGRHFYGHGVFSKNGKLLFAAENSIDDAKGIIGVYDATNEFKPVGAFSSHGIGPHEIIMMEDTHTLCIANGGIETHPDFGRQKLNLSSMRSSIVLLNSETGDLKAQYFLEPHLHRLSLRHMARDKYDNIWIGGQYQGNRGDDVPLIAQLSRDNGLLTPPLNSEIQQSLAHYVGSVAADMSGKLIALTSPKGNTMVIIDAQSGRVISQRTIQSVCGVAGNQNDFAFSTHNGVLSAQGLHEHKTKHFDNHISAFGVSF